jgi:anti-sigma B factor antagonist
MAPVRHSAAIQEKCHGADAMVGNRPRGVSIEGRVTIDTSGDMRRKIAEALHSIPPAVTVDFSGVTYLDTSGLATLLEASRIARQQGTRLVVEGLHDQPRELLHFTQIDRLLEVAEPEPHEPQDQPQPHGPKDQPL